MLLDIRVKHEYDRTEKCHSGLDPQSSAFVRNMLPYFCGGLKKYLIIKKVLDFACFSN